MSIFSFTDDSLWSTWSLCGPMIHENLHETHYFFFFFQIKNKKWGSGSILITVVLKFQYIIYIYRSLNILIINYLNKTDKDWKSCILYFHFVTVLCDPDLYFPCFSFWKGKTKILLVLFLILFPKGRWCCESSWWWEYYAMN